LLAILRGHELGHLRRNEARELGSLALDRLEQPGVRSGDRRLVGKGLDEVDLLGGVRDWLGPNEVEDSDELPLDEQRGAEQRTDPSLVGRGPLVFGVLENVRDVDDLVGEYDSPVHALSIARRGMRMVTFVLVQLRWASVTDRETQHVALEQVHL